VRVCDPCFEDLLSERQASQGVVMSGRLARGAKEDVLLVRLSHLALTFFGSSAEDSGKLLSTLHLSDVISIRASAANKALFAVGDTGGNTMVLRAATDAEAGAWVDAIVRTKNELLDAVARLDPRLDREPQVLMVTCRDAATLGPWDVCVSRNVGFRAPFRLPLLTARGGSEVVLQLRGGTARVTGPEMRDAGDAGSPFWVRATREVGASSRRLSLQLRVQKDASVPLGIAHALSLWGWLTRAPNVDLPLPAISLLSAALAAPLHPACLLAAAALALFAVGSLPAGRVLALVNPFATGAGALFLAAAGVAAARGDDWKEPTQRYTLTLVAFAWDDAAADPRAAADAKPACPERFLRMVRGDAELAAQWWAKTKRWRATVAPERLLTLRARPSYGDIKRDIQHYFHKRDRRGRVVYYEVLDAPQAAFRSLEAKGWSLDDVVEHMIFVNEFMYREVLQDYDEEGCAATPSGQMVKVMDVSRLGLGDVGGAVSAYFHKVGVMGKHYPERLDKILVINVPASFSMVWAIAAPLLDRNVRERISIYRADYHAALFDLIDPTNVPTQYGGTCQCAGGCRHHSPEETLLAARVGALNAKAAPGGTEASEVLRELANTEITWNESPL
jgi:hypothetical protein